MARRSASTKRMRAQQQEGAYGVRGISLREGDEVVGMDVLRAPGAILTVTENGYGKRTDSEEYGCRSWRHGPHQHPDVRSQRQRRRHRPCHRR